MAEQSRLFLGLVRPPKLLGLPIMYAMVWLFGSVLIFVWLQHWAVAAIAAAAYLSHPGSWYGFFLNSSGLSLSQSFMACNGVLLPRTDCGSCWLYSHT